MIIRRKTEGNLDGELAHQTLANHLRFVATAITLAEGLALLVLFRALLPTRRLYAIFQYLYFAVYLAEDVLETGEYGYHMMLCMEKL